MSVFDNSESNVNYKLIHEKRERTGSTYKVKRSRVPVVKGTINLEGSRAVDNGEFVIHDARDMSTNNNETISFISDDVPVEHLSFAQNFYYNVRDESGNNLDGYRIDGSNQVPVYGVEDNTNFRHLGHKYLDCATQSQVIRCKPSDEEGNKWAIHWDDSWEIQLWIKTPSSMSNDTKQIVFNRMDGDTGIEVGLHKSSNQMRVYFEMKLMKDNGTKISKITSTDSDLNVGTNEEVFIRIYDSRNTWDANSGKYKRTAVAKNNSSAESLYVNSDDYKFEEKDQSKDIYIGSNASSGNKFRGRIYSIRVYNKKISTNQATRIWKRVVPITTMKYAGRITDITKRGRNTVVNSVGWGSLLLNTFIKNDLFTQGNSLNNNGIYVWNDSSNTTKERTLLENIVEDIMLNINVNMVDGQGKDYNNGKLGKDIEYEWQYHNEGDEDDINGESDDGYFGFHKYSFSHPRNVNRYDSAGRLIDTIRILGMMGNKWYANDTTTTLQHLKGADQFFILPRKVFVFESSEIPNKSYFDISKGYVISGGQYDDTNIINHVTIFGEQTKSTRRIGFDNTQANRTYPSFASANTFDLQYYADNNNYDEVFVDLDFIEMGNTPVVLVEGRDYDWNGSVITWLSSVTSDTSTISISWKRIKLENASYYTAKNTTLINRDNIRSGSFHVPQLGKISSTSQTGISTGDITTITQLSKRILGSKAEPEKSVVIKVPRLINGIGIGSSTVVNSEAAHLHNESLVVKRLTYKFPSFVTTVQCGDYAYDLTDDLRDMGEDINSFKTQFKDTN